MAGMTSITELRSMQTADLRKDIAEQELLVIKLRMGVKLGKDKDSAKYVRERKQLARMKTIWSEMHNSEQSASASEKSNVESTAKTPARGRKSSKKAA